MAARSSVVRSFGRTLFCGPCSRTEKLDWHSNANRAALVPAHFHQSELQVEVAVWEGRGSCRAFRLLGRSLALPNQPLDKDEVCSRHYGFCLLNTINTDSFSLLVANFVGRFALSSPVS